MVKRILYLLFWSIWLLPCMTFMFLGVILHFIYSGYYFIRNGQKYFTFNSIGDRLYDLVIIIPDKLFGYD